MKTIPLWRRFALAFVTLLLASSLFRGQIATALVTRGDDAVRNGDPAAGVRYYRRALAIDAHASRAADRVAFYLGMRHQPGDAQAAIDVATHALERLGDDPALLADRGLAEQHLQRWRAAEGDFARAGTVGHDARYDHLAGRIALRLRNVRDARRFFALALLHDPAFGPARAAMKDLQ